MPGKKWKFPTPADVQRQERAVLCTADRVIKLYNQGNGDEAKRIAKKVKKWFSAEADKRGWAGVRFLKEVQSSHGAGCILWLPPQQINIEIQVTQEVLVLHPEDDD